MDGVSIVVHVSDSCHIDKKNVVEVSKDVCDGRLMNSS